MGPIVISLETTELTQEEQQILTHPNIGGIILFARNFIDKFQLIELITAIKAINSNLIIMVDHEGGRVWRFKSGFTNPGPMQQLGKLYDQNAEEAITQAFTWGKQIAKELISCGIDVNLAPLLDLYHDGISEVIGDRALHYDPLIIIKLAESFIIGQKQVGIKSVGKHFPGHGAIAADSHDEIAIDNRCYQELITTDIIPFKNLIKQNILSIIMPSHVIYPKIDNKPASLSSIWLKNILRKRLNFNGTIISDCLSMSGVQQFIKEKYKELQNTDQINLKITQEALTAGCDLVIFNNVHKNNLLFLLENIKSKINA